MQFGEKDKTEKRKNAKRACAWGKKSKKNERFFAKSLFFLALS